MTTSLWSGWAVTVARICGRKSSGHGGGSAANVADLGKRPLIGGTTHLNMISQQCEGLSSEWHLDKGPRLRAISEAFLWRTGSRDGCCAPAMWLLMRFWAMNAAIFNECVGSSISGNTSSATTDLCQNSAKFLVV